MRGRRGGVRQPSAPFRSQAQGVFRLSSEAQNFTVWGFIKGFGKLLIGLLLLLQGVIGLFLLLLFLGVFAAAMNGVSGGKESSVKIAKGSALVMDLDGVLVEQAETVDPFERAIEEAYGASEPDQIEVHEVVRVIREAREDERIEAIVLNLGALYIPSYSASKMHYVAGELDAFKAAGKRIIAVGDFYSQEQYLLAARADEIYMNDYGNIVLYGYGRYGMYLKSFLEKLKITSHVFRVGTFKSAVEPFIRDDMSEEAKAANAAFLNVLWDAYARSVEEARGLPQGSISRYADDLGSLLRGVDGDLAKLAVDYGLVDGLKSRQDQLDYLKETFGEAKDGGSFKSVSFRDYLKSLGDRKDGDAPNVAVVTAAGPIVDGEQPDGVAAGGDTVAQYLRQALEDDEVKAVVLRVDSPGGSAFASEVMREGVLALKQAGKPVVVSMGSLAASGGYWISAPGDEIWAAPTTITGSIGIFGFFSTFENTAAEIGVYVDGVGTSALSPTLATGVGPLPDPTKDVIQQSIENGYEKFMAVVGEGRGLDRDYVDSIGQGRVWIGETAKELKLVDNLGGYDEALDAAARLAEIDDYDAVRIFERIGPFEKFFSSSAARTLKLFGVDRKAAALTGSSLRKAVAQVEKNLVFFDQFNDPSATYARCLACEGR